MGAAKPDRSAKRGALLAACVAALLGASAPAMAQTVDTYGPTIARAKSKAKGPRDFRGVWVQRIWVPELVKDPPLNAAAKANAKLASPQDSRGAKCLPQPWPNGINTPYPIEIFQLDGVTLISYEVHGQLRRIWTDGRKHPVDAEPAWYGHSIGHWEGNTFVVDTTNIKGIDNDVSPVHTVERYTMSKDGRQLDIDFTLEDPRIYTGPVKIKRVFYLTDVDILEWYCEENNRNNPDEPGPLNLTHGPPTPTQPFGGILTDRNVDKYVPELAKPK